MVFSINITKGSRNSGAGASGILKQVNGVNGMPIAIAPGFPDLQDQFNQMGITHIRLHDCFGVADIDDGFVANRSSNQNQLIPNVPLLSQEKAKTFIADFVNKRTIFPYAAAGMRANDLTLASQSPNFATTDSYLKQILNNVASVNPGNIQREVFFRVGRTLDGGYEVPANFDIYASLVGQIVQRYAIDYQSVGLPRKVTYWEIWNEPDLTFFWNNNNPQVYYEFYSKVARMIKSIDPSAKVGGAGVANGYNPGGAYLDGLLNYCRSTGTPIDFLSWHYYGNRTGDPLNVIDIGNSIQSALNRYGYSNIESICSEWNSSPFSTVNTFSKVQSAKNAAYIVSSLIGMQYCKTDKAYYYRGDGSSFGMFNDNGQPLKPSKKTFCTYAAQSFNLFTRLFETPYILNQSNTFSTGLTTLAAENATGNKMNIIAANFEVGYGFVTGEVPADQYYKQYYLDTSKTVNQLTSTANKNKWFGGSDPRKLSSNNAVEQNRTVADLPTFGSLPSRSRSYGLSNTGLGVQINGIGSNYQGYLLTVYRIKEGGRLDRMTPEEVSSSIAAYMSNGILHITDTGAGSSTVTLYSVEFTTGPNGNTTDPNGGTNSGGNTGGGGIINGNTNSVTYEVPIAAGIRTPLGMVLPQNYMFIANQQYKLTISKGVSSCTAGNGIDVTVNRCAKVGDAQYSYKNSVFTPFISGILQSYGSTLIGSSFVYLAGGGKVTCTLTPL
ncbi:hypothetical protein CIN_12410 [Commensalibacter intestini A911]|uniref:Glycosyl hydrolases family 39 N-terminal catalytic domain-containing protein n=1 Tax=Commensalibacter intestini A911 TaxID=1088868 RepID=G6F188_9PROT|nr:glycoside hydrolase family 39 [Commensalibacter intestini]EHD13882.1 hypothetical protein CIN_12410 [Commensalibacter intestini A911]